jgi:hypothetical protein
VIDVEAQQLAKEATRILRFTAGFCERRAFADAHQEMPVRRERNHSTVVRRAGSRDVEQLLARSGVRRVAGRLITIEVDAAVEAGVAHEKATVLGILRMKRQAQHSAFSTEGRDEGARIEERPAR